jgi:hypothetical protein
MLMVGRGQYFSIAKMFDGRHGERIVGMPTFLPMVGWGQISVNDRKLVGRLDG